MIAKAYAAICKFEHYDMLYWPSLQVETIRANPLAAMKVADEDSPTCAECPGTLQQLGHFIVSATDALRSSKSKRSTGQKQPSRTSSNSEAVSVGWRPSLVGWRPSLVGWRPSLVGQ